MCRAAAYVMNVTQGDAPTRQAGNDTSTSEMGSDWISLEWSHFSGNRPAWCKNWKRRKERRWLRFLRHLLGGWHCIVGTASTEPQMCGFCLPARHHQDPRLPPRVFIQSYSSESSLRLRPLPKMECYSTRPQEATPPVGRLTFWSSVYKKK